MNVWMNDWMNEKEWNKEIIINDSREGIVYW